MVVKTGLSRRTWLPLAIAILVGTVAVAGCRVAEEEVEQTPTPTPWHSPGAPVTGAITVEPTRAPAPTSVGTTPPMPSPTEPAVGAVVEPIVSPTDSPGPTAPPVPTASPPIVAPSPRVGPIEGAEPYQLRTDEAGKYYIPDRGDGCTWAQQLALIPLQGGDSPIIVLYSDCEAKFYLAYHVAEQYIGNVTKSPVYQPLPLTPVDIGLGADGKYYVPDRGDGCAYWEAARPTIGGQQWVMLRSELCHHFLWRFSLATGDLFPMDPLWWPDRSAPSPSDIRVGPDGRYFIARSDGCTWVESSRSDEPPVYIYFTTDCNFRVPYAYNTTTGEFHGLGVP